MRASLALVTLLIASPLPSFGQAKAPTPPPAAPPAPSHLVPPICSELERLAEDGLKEVAQSTYSGVLDNSAPRETNRLLKVNAAWNTINAQLLHMSLARCPAPGKPLLPDAYKRAAIGCLASKPEEKERCDRSKWLRDADLPAQQ